MRKILLTAAFAALTLASSVSANWITGEPTILAVNSGEAAFHTALTSDQRLDVNLTAGAEGKADLTFTTKASESELSLTALPVLVSEEAGFADAKLTITPLVNDANGLRFYLVDTGEAAHISFPIKAPPSRAPSLPRIWKISMVPLLSPLRRNRSSSTRRKMAQTPPILFHSIQSRSHSQR